ncbi:putative membrane-anchored protein [Paraburkholderia sp. WSM4175]
MGLNRKLVCRNEALAQVGGISAFFNSNSSSYAFSIPLVKPQLNVTVALYILFKFAADFVHVASVHLIQVETTCRD